MARRIKEEPIVHQNRIAGEASLLFTKQGIEKTTMDEIAKAAGYSKATLYVYFKNKEAIIDFLALKSMELLKEWLTEALEMKGSSREKMFAMCFALVKYQREYPVLFEMSLRNIGLDLDSESHSYLSQAFVIGEEVNQMVGNYISKGIERGELKKTDNMAETILHIWGHTAGLIKLASEKEAYIQLVCKMSVNEFLKDGFERVYQSISK